ncbi:hypothetical protein E2562_027457, partial [Oryza meyeriana var. granulata]
MTVSVARSSTISYVFIRKGGGVVATLAALTPLLTAAEYTTVSIGKFKVVSSADSEEPAALVCKLEQYNLCQEGASKLLQKSPPSRSCPSTAAEGHRCRTLLPSLSCPPMCSPIFP